ncbi:hypothetical protein K491DRAFT_677919 [Lophiostoma macrostomum CBS 122681]|uniref:Uncharacterized protein n=1 Tax=Lophiostoma macrostomum CBS 122681 TaxID=1314788 RepID=A0A6A6TCK0_9PLEO|nr:hypothetical protein K491DRAFT_677919 [Lophiostoma macrostomum CBS 122681]
MSASQGVNFADVEYSSPNDAVSIGLFSNDTRTLLPGPKTTATFERISQIEFTANGSITRQFGTGTAWVLTPNDLTIAPIPKTEKPLQLSLVLQKQHNNEPNHWSLFVARQGERGYVYQVKGAHSDAPIMTHRHAANIDLVNTRSFVASCVMASPLSDADAVLVHNYAHSEAPPCARHGETRTENCQGWAYRVLQRLVEHGVVSQATVEYVLTLMEPMKLATQQELGWKEEKVQQVVVTVRERPGTAW